MFHQRSRRVFVFFFFFQAEDGIRDLTVTGVQTCALPISRDRRSPPGSGRWRESTTTSHPRRSEERRVGKSVDLGGRRIIKKKKNSSVTGRTLCAKIVEAATPQSAP